MSTYYYDSGLSYVQYLQARSFTSDITKGAQKAAKSINLAVSRQTRELIASQEALARENIRCLESGLSRLEGGLDQLAWEVQDVGRGIAELNATFQWGFGEMVAQLGRLNSAVSELVKSAKTPIQTLANNHFQIARDAFRQGLCEEALEEVEKAISVYKLEWRYYTLSGTIRLGSASRGLEFVDLAKAEELFLLAARYAKADSPEDAARALLAAGWAAYCQGKMGQALTHSEQCITLQPQLAEGLFQTAKVYMALGEPDNGLPLLGQAIDLDKRYALKAAADGDFQSHEQALRQFLETFRDQKLRRVVAPVQAALAKYDFWLSRSETARQNPLVVRARSVVDVQLPLWDLLSALSDLAELPSALDNLASQVRFVVRSESPGPDYQMEEKYVEEIPKDAGLFRRLAGAKQRTRSIGKQGFTESIAIHNAAGSVFIRMELCHIPPARFRTWRFDKLGGHEQSVRISRAYLMSATPITNVQYSVATGVEPGGSSEPLMPVVNVSWYDAAALCNALSREVGFEEAYTISPRGAKWKGLQCAGYRLPTEAEWEYACLGSTAGLRWVLDAIDEMAWLKENSGGVLHQVAAKQPNSRGLYDMLGNVSEWVFDWCVDERWSEEEEDPIGPNERQEVYTEQIIAKGKAVRGGCYSDPESYVRSGAPARPLDPSQRYPTVGCRIARTAGWAPR